MVSNLSELFQIKNKATFFPCQWSNWIDIHSLNFLCKTYMYVNFSPVFMGLTVNLAFNHCYKKESSQVAWIKSPLPLLPPMDSLYLAHCETYGPVKKTSVKISRIY